MTKKKGFLTTLFGNKGCNCGLSVESETDISKEKAKKGGCCDMQIIEEPTCTCEEERSENAFGHDCCGNRKAPPEWRGRELYVTLR